MGTVKLSQGRPFAPFYGWTRQDYEAALLRAMPTDLRCDDSKISPARFPVGALGLLEAIGPKLAWQRDALCLEYPDVDFFADRDQDAARAVCERCLCRAECRTAGEHEVGVWGATTSRERARLRRAKVA